MNEIDEETALSIIFANTRRKKRKEDLLTIARSFDYLVKLYGSKKRVAEKVDLSTEMIREFLTVLTLPPDVLKLVAERKIDRIDVVGEIASLHDAKQQIAMAEEFENRSSKDVRDIKHLVKHKKVSIKDAVQTILDAEAKELHIVIVDFDNETFREIERDANSLGTKPPELIRKLSPMRSCEGLAECVLVNLRSYSNCKSIQSLCISSRSLNPRFLVQ